MKQAWHHEGIPGIHFSYLGSISSGFFWVSIKYRYKPLLQSDTTADLEHVRKFVPSSFIIVICKYGLSINTPSQCRITPSCCGCVWYGTVRHIWHYETTDSSGIQRKRPTSISNKKPLQVNLPILPKASRASRSQAPIPCWKILKKSSIYY